MLASATEEPGRHGGEAIKRDRERPNVRWDRLNPMQKIIKYGNSN